MILKQYTEEINNNPYPRANAKRVAQLLNREDPFCHYVVSYDLGTKKYIIEKFEIKGMK